MIKASSHVSRTMRTGVTGVSVHAVAAARPSCASRKVTAVVSVGMTVGKTAGIVVAVGTVVMIVVTTAVAVIAGMAGGVRRNRPS
jgi:hypothetical protein